MKNKKLLALTATLSLTAGAFAATNASAEKYTIQSGDSLYTISQQFNTTVESLMEVNQLTSDLIFINDTIEVSSNGDVYIIEPNDSLFEIAAAHNVTVEQLKAWNGLSSDLILAGETLSVSGPVKEVATVTSKSQVASSNNAAQASAPVAKTVQTPSASSSSSSNVARTMTVEATAYTAFCAGCSGTTANGTNLRANPNAKVIAVDPNVIPLGTKVWVEGYGEAIAADTGGAIKGNKIDVFIPNKEGAYDWGRRTVTIKILN